MNGAKKSDGEVLYGFLKRDQDPAWDVLLEGEKRRYERAAASFARTCRALAVL